MMIQVQRQGIDNIMSKVQDRIKRPVTLDEISNATGITRVTLRKMREGDYANPDKLKPVYEFLYKLGGLKPPKRVAIAWLVWEDDAPEGNVETGHALSLPSSADSAQEETHAANQ